MKEFILKENSQVKLVLFNDRFEIHQSDNQINEYGLQGLIPLRLEKESIGL